MGTNILDPSQLSNSSFIFMSFSVTPLDVVKTRLQAQQKALISNKCFLYCNGLMDHLCPCGPSSLPPNTTQFKGTIVSIT